MVNELNDIIRYLLKSNEGFLELAVKQRAKFEGWLKFELAHALKCKYHSVEVEFLSKRIDGKKVLVDLYANNSFIELKTANTNYCKELCDSPTRPITKNVESINHDIEKLNSISFPGKKYIAFAMFPLDSEQAYKGHIGKIVGNLKSHKEEIVDIKGIPVLVFTGEVENY